MTLPHSTRHRLRLGQPSDLLAMIPFMLGFHPSESLVVVAMRDTTVAFGARDDLPPAGWEPPPEQADYLIDVVRRQRCNRVLLVGYGPDDRVSPALAALAAAFRAASVTVLESLRAEGGKYWSYLCTNDRCCPSQGTPYDVSTSEVAAAWTLEGRVAWRDRAEYEAQILPVSGPTRAAMGRATAAAHTSLLALLTAAADEEHAEAMLHDAGHLAISAALDRQLNGEPPTDEQAAWLSVLLQSIPIRDMAWGLIRGDETSLRQHRALWQEVLRRAEPDLVAAPASLFAFAAWRDGDGAIARLALERALVADPGYRMANLLYQALTAGVPPSAFDAFDEAAAHTSSRMAAAPVRRARGGRRRRRSSKDRAGSPPA
jgi:hypothetical protein